MFKKPLLIIALTGLLLITAGLILSPSFVGKFTEGGKINTERGLIVISLFQFYAIVLGGVIALESIVINFLPKGKRVAQYLLSICFIGLIITITGVVFSPSFIEEKLNLFKVVETRFNSLCNLQASIITIGCLIIFISLFLYRRKLTTKKFVTLFQIIIFLMYLVLIDITFINAKYPSNIFLKPSEYGKVLDFLLGQDVLLSDFSPRPTLKVQRKQILKAKYPVIDVHFHFQSAFITERDKKIIAPENLIRDMDSLGIKMIVGFDATDLTIEKLLKQYQEKYPGRFLVFSDMVSIQGRILSDEFLSGLPAKLEKFQKLGMRGIGEFVKDIGLKMKDTSGKLIPIDDPRLDPFYAKAGELGMPIIWHVGDPTSFWHPVNKFNERFIELRTYPFWSYVELTPKEVLLKQLEEVLKSHPQTIFIGAHIDWMADDLTHAAYFLDTYSNYYVEFGSTLSELGRQPYTARKFFIKYQDRILFGTDGGGLFEKGWTVEKYYRAYFEFLETDNEYFDYPLKGPINQGDWKIYGINLPDSVLQKIYYKNAERILNIKNYRDNG